MDTSQQPPTSIGVRKADHIALVSENQGAFRHKSTLLEQVHLLHNALPEIHHAHIDLRTSLFGKTLQAPLFICAMTGGTKQAKDINRDLAKAAEELGIGFGLGSQRAMLLQPDCIDSFSIRDIAPTTLVFANLGLVQARETPSERIRQLVQNVGADVLCIHLNPAMELIQAEGDRDFRGGLDTLRRLRAELGIPLVVKETGCGISKKVGTLLQQIGVAGIDVSGAGGTSWVGVETKRASGLRQALGEELWEWGIPTAASLCMVRDLNLPILASGGLRSGLDVARALALGAQAGGLAAPVLQAQQRAGCAGVLEFLQGIISAVQAVMLLTGCRTPAELKHAPKILGPDLRTWLQETHD